MRYVCDMLDKSLPDTLKAFAAREFSGEQLVWAEQPDVRIVAMLSFAIWFFAIPWTVFSLFWISIPVGTLYEAYIAANSDNPKGPPPLMMWVFAIFGMPFVAIGFGMLLTPFWIWWKGQHTLHVLTDKRMATLQGISTISVISVLPGEISGFSRKEGPDGRGTLILHLGYERDSEGGRVPKKVEFGVISDVRRVEELVREMKAQASG